MRTTAEVNAEIETLNRPRVRVWPRDIEGEAKQLQWAADHPELESQYDALLEELELIEETRAKAERARHVFGELVNCGVGVRTVEVITGQPALTPALEATREWLKSDKTWLVLSGAVGTGKSIAAADALREEQARSTYTEGFFRLGDYRKPQGTFAFRRVSEVARMSAFNEGAKELERLKSVAMLVLDDLGTECATAWGTSLLHEIMDVRHDNKLRTIITTNIKRDALKASLGDRLADRIRQDGKIVWLEGKSMRGQTHDVGSGATNGPKSGPDGGSA